MLWERKLTRPRLPLCVQVDPAKDLNNEYTARCLMVLVRELSMGDQWSKDRIIQQSEQLLKMGER